MELEVLDTSANNKEWELNPRPLDRKSILSSSFEDCIWWCTGFVYIDIYTSPQIHVHDGKTMPLHLTMRRCKFALRTAFAHSHKVVFPTDIGATSDSSLKRSWKTISLQNYRYVLRTAFVRTLLYLLALTKVMFTVNAVCKSPQHHTWVGLRGWAEWLSPISWQ